MKKGFGNYRLLANGGRRNGSLWEGPDHLLIINTSGFLAGFTETYRRIDYRNIQAISLARTRKWGWSLALLLALIALFAWIAYTISEANAPANYIFGALSMVFVIALVVHLVKGPTCVCKLQTAVQFLHLKMLDRMPGTSRVLAKLGPLCTAHQGGQSISDGQLRAGAEAHAGPAAAAPFSATASGISPPSMKPAWTGSKVVTWAMLLLIASGAVIIADLFIKHMLFFTLDVILVLAAAGVVVAATTRASRWELPAALKTALWGGVINMTITCVTAFALLTVARIRIQESHGFRGGVYAEDNYASYRYLSDAGFEELGWGAWVIVAVGVGAIFFGLLGLPNALRPASAPPSEPSAPPPPLS